MILKPAWTVDDLRNAPLGATLVWATPSVVSLVRRELPFDVAREQTPLNDHLDTLVAVGGGTLIDRAKSACRDRDHAIRLIAVPSIWGSGAEASPVLVLDHDGAKEIRIDLKYIPDQRVIWPELTASLPAERARHACGDCWSHALEGFLSPLATEELRGELAGVVRTMLGLPLGNDSRWFEPSGEACAGQARSSVGLIHGIAHTLEAPLRTQHWGHAKLCAVFLYPVMCLNRQVSNRATDLQGQYGLDPDGIMKVLRELFDPTAYAQALPLLLEHWRAILRDPCTRTNCALVRPQHLDYFRSQEFLR